VTVLWVALTGAIVYLDTTAVAQIMICQPLIVCPLWGLIVGRPEIGLFFGVAFQLLWLGSFPVGAARFPEGNIGALVATAVAAGIPAAENGQPAWIVLTLATVVGILTAHLGSEVTPLVRKLMSRYSPQVVKAAQEGRRRRFALLYFGAVGIHAGAGFLLTALAFLVGKWIFALYLGPFAALGLSEALVAQTDRMLSGIWPALLGAGAAIVAGRFVQRVSAKWFVLSLAAGLGVGWLCL